MFVASRHHDENEANKILASSVSVWIDPRSTLPYEVLESYLLVPLLPSQRPLIAGILGKCGLWPLVKVLRFQELAGKLVKFPRYELTTWN